MSAIPYAHEPVLRRCPRVTLDDCELHLAATVGCWRRIRVIREALGRGHGEATMGAWDRHLIGALAELAFAKLLGVYWGGASQDFGKDGDVAGLELRATTHARGHLVVYADDPDDRVLVLAIVEPSVVRFPGLIVAEAAKLACFDPPANKLRGEPRAVRTWWVPQDHLTPLPREVRTLMTRRLPLSP